MTNWPWPLTGVQDWFEGLWNHVTDAVWGAVESLWSWVWSGLTSIRDSITSTVNWVYGKLKDAVGDVSDWVTATWQALAQAVSNAVESIVGTVANWGDWVITSITKTITKIQDWINSGVAWVADQVQTGLNSAFAAVSSSLTSFGAAIMDAVGAGTSWLATHITNAVESATSAIGTAVSNFAESTQTFVTDAISGGLNWVQQALKGVAGAMGDALTGFFDWLLKHLSWFGEMIWGGVELLLGRMKDAALPVMRMLTDAITGALTPGSPPKDLKIATDVLAETAFQKQLEVINSMYKSEPSLAQLFSASKQLQSMLLVAGISASAAAIISELAHPFRDLGIRATVREIVYWSGIPSVTAEIATTPTAIGLIIPMRYALLSMWTPMIPPADDLIRFAVREVYVPERREALMAAYPGEQFTKLMSKHGFKQEYVEHYWMAHWVLPSVSQLNEMLYRKLITIEQWTAYVIYNDYIPEMVPNLRQIIYNPYTRVDARRMYDLGILDDAQMYENFLWLGYDEEHAKTMTLWSKAYIIAGDIRALYSKGWINEDGARQMVISAGIPEERAEIFLKKLVRLEQPARVMDERDLTKTDILRLLKMYQIEPEQARSMLVMLGYDEVEAGYLVDLTLYQPDIELRELTMSQILKAYVYEIYDRDKAKQELIIAGWSAEAAETLLVLEDVKRKDAQITKQAERDLSRTDIIKGIKVEIIDKDTGFQYLAYMGYSDWEINFIFALEGIE